MKHIRLFSAFLLLLTLLLTGCSAESIMEQGADLLDRIFAGDSSDPRIPAGSAPEPSAEPAPEPAGQEQEKTQFPEAAEPSIPAEQEPPVSDPPPSVPSGNITPSHTDATFFGPGESFRYLPEGTEGVYACTYASDDESIAAVDPDTGKVTAVGPGTTKVRMHVECCGQFDFEFIVRCSCSGGGEEPRLPDGESAPSLPAEPADSPAPSTGAVSASHSDATFFNPKERFKFLPIGADDRYTCTYATGDAKIAAVDEKGVVTAVGPGTTTITMTVDGGGTEYIFECIVRCKWTESE